MPKQLEWFQPSYGHGDVWLAVFGDSHVLEVRRGSEYGRFFAAITVGRYSTIGRVDGYDTVEDAQAIAIAAAKLQLALSLRDLDVDVSHLTGCLPRHKYAIGDSVNVSSVPTMSGTVEGVGTIVGFGEKYSVQELSPQYSVEINGKWLLWEHDITLIPRVWKFKVGDLVWDEDVCHAPMKATVEQCPIDNRGIYVVRWESGDKLFSQEKNLSPRTVTLMGNHVIEDL